MAAGGFGVVGRLERLRDGFIGWKLGVLVFRVLKFGICEILGSDFGGFGKFGLGLLGIFDAMGSWGFRLE